jgi:hypothetical protein
LSHSNFSCANTWSLSFVFFSFDADGDDVIWNLDNKEAALVAELDTLLANAGDNMTEGDDDEVGLLELLLLHGVRGELTPFISFLLFGREVEVEPLFRFLELYNRSKHST